MLAPISHLASAERLLGRSFVATTESHGPKSVLGTASANTKPTQDLRADRPPRAPIRGARKIFARQTVRSKTTPRSTQLTLANLWASSQAQSSPSPLGPWRRRHRPRDNLPGRPVLGSRPHSSTRTNARIPRAARCAMIPAAAKRTFGEDLHVVHFNVCAIPKEDAYMVTMDRMFYEAGYHIVILVGTQLDGNTSFSGEHYRRFAVGRENKQSPDGIMICVTHSFGLSSAVTAQTFSWKGRILQLRVEHPCLDCVVGGAYSYTECDDDSLKAGFWNALELSLASWTARPTVVMGIDANGHGGLPSTPGFGPIGVEALTPNGARLSDFMHIHGLIALNSFCNDSAATAVAAGTAPQHGTWYHRATAQWSRIDYLLVDQRFAAQDARTTNIGTAAPVGNRAADTTSILSSASFPLVKEVTLGPIKGAGVIGLDHIAVRARINVRLDQKYTHARGAKVLKFDPALLQDRDRRAAFAAAFTHELRQYCHGQALQDLYDAGLLDITSPDAPYWNYDSSFVRATWLEWTQQRLADLHYNCDLSADALAASEGMGWRWKRDLDADTRQAILDSVNATHRYQQHLVNHVAAATDYPSWTKEATILQSRAIQLRKCRKVAVACNKRRKVARLATAVAEAPTLREKHRAGRSMFKTRLWRPGPPVGQSAIDAHQAQVNHLCEPPRCCTPVLTRPSHEEQQRREAEAPARLLPEQLLRELRATNLAKALLLQRPHKACRRGTLPSDSIVGAARDDPNFKRHYAEFLEVLYRKTIKCGFLPVEGATASTAWIAKGAQPSGWDDFRIICLLQRLWSPLAIVTARSLTRVARLHPAFRLQFAYLPQKSADLYAIGMAGLLSRLRTASMPALLLCLDICKAFDTVSREKMYQAVEAYAASMGWTVVLQTLHSEVMYEITDSHGNVSWVYVPDGVRQGAIEAAIVFAMVMADATAQIQRDLHTTLETTGTSDGDNLACTTRTNLNMWLYGDDTTMILPLAMFERVAGTPCAGFNQIIKIVQTKFATFGLALQFRKVKVLVTPGKGKKAMELSQGLPAVGGYFANGIQRVHSHKVVGTIFTATGSFATTVTHRRVRGAQLHAQVGAKFWHAAQISARHRSTVYRTYVGTGVLFCLPALGPLPRRQMRSLEGQRTQHVRSLHTKVEDTSTETQVSISTAPVSVLRKRMSIPTVQSELAMRRLALFLQFAHGQWPTALMELARHPLRWTYQCHDLTTAPSEPDTSAPPPVSWDEYTIPQWAEVPWEKRLPFFAAVLGDFQVLRIRCTDTTILERKIAHEVRLLLADAPASDDLSVWATWCTRLDYAVLQQGLKTIMRAYEAYPDLGTSADTRDWQCDLCAASFDNRGAYLAHRNMKHAQLLFQERFDIDVIQRCCRPGALLVDCCPACGAAPKPDLPGTTHPQGPWGWLGSHLYMRAKTPELQAELRPFSKCGFAFRQFLLDEERQATFQQDVDQGVLTPSLVEPKRSLNRFLGTRPEKLQHQRRAVQQALLIVLEQKRIHLEQAAVKPLSSQGPRDIVDWLKPRQAPASSVNAAPADQNAWSDHRHPASALDGSVAVPSGLDSAPLHRGPGQASRTSDLHGVEQVSESDRLVEQTQSDTCPRTLRRGIPRANGNNPSDAPQQQRQYERPKHQVHVTNLGRTRTDQRTRPQKPQQKQKVQPPLIAGQRPLAFFFKPPPYSSSPDGTHDAAQASADAVSGLRPEAPRDAPTSKFCSPDRRGPDPEPVSHQPARGGRQPIRRTTVPGSPVHDATDGTRPREPTSKFCFQPSEGLGGADESLWRAPEGDQPVRSRSAPRELSVRRASSPGHRQAEPERECTRPDAGTRPREHELSTRAIARSSFRNGQPRAGIDQASVEPEQLRRTSRHHDQSRGHSARRDSPVDRGEAVPRCEPVHARGTARPRHEDDSLRRYSRSPTRRGVNHARDDRRTPAGTRGHAGTRPTFSAAMDHQCAEVDTVPPTQRAHPPATGLAPSEPASRPRHHSLTGHPGRATGDTSHTARRGRDDNHDRRAAVPRVPDTNGANHPRQGSRHDRDVYDESATVCAPRGLRVRESDDGGRGDAMATDDHPLAAPGARRRPEPPLSEWTECAGRPTPGRPVTPAEPGGAEATQAEPAEVAGDRDRPKGAANTVRDPLDLGVPLVRPRPRHQRADATGIGRMVGGRQERAAWNGPGASCDSGVVGSTDSGSRHDSAEYRRCGQLDAARRDQSATPQQPLPDGRAAVCTAPGGRHLLHVPHQGESEQVAPDGGTHAQAATQRTGHGHRRGQPGSHDLETGPENDLRRHYVVHDSTEGAVESDLRGGRHPAPDVRGPGS